MSLPAPALRVVLVDDDPLVLRALTRLLRVHRCEAFVDPREALARLRAGPTPDVVVLDVGMPFLDGPALYRLLPWALRERCLFLSGGHEGDAVLEPAHAWRVLPKPIPREALLEAVAAVGVRG